MTRLPQRSVGVRTPSSAMLVQMLFVVSALGTGAIGALVTWLGPKRAAPPPPPPREKETADDDA